ncbi:Phosphoinositide phospholipase C, Ca2+-dependent [Pseudoxanthomonas sp. GM95]|uniref:Ca2+-dependent phosphoinositide-specific phospholipase C n=1 Tax=Pseudoxanthomonas sp. GM95 TaxID=1881043 RepID=UPI0008C6A23C|nr:Ca2+-dependent phosphoinositide-specific phospholipase C [Pseudoxanthomonas sp. GM95]SEL59826.1 Phosphoinositide phospholipase C, Ca2+-dependent [Pseudoxanthomonas sp. GM95]
MGQYACKAVLGALLAVVSGVNSTHAQEVPVRLNDLRAVGTHNSYKQPMPAETMVRLQRDEPAMAQALDYAHRPLVEQLDHGARQLELDVNYDPRGGHYAAGSSAPDLLAPGFKVLHMPGLDNTSSCVRLVQCLQVLRDWSDAHPRHVPILLLFNAKDDQNAKGGGIDALRFDAAAFDALDAEIRSVLPANKLIVPDEVQGDFPTLRQAVLAGQWPTLEQARGRFIFALDEQHPKVALYQGTRRSLEGRVFFVNTDASASAAAYMTINDPIKDGDRIRRAVQQGFLVRTRADADTREARANDTRRRDAALASGAHYISTDYLWPDPRVSVDYVVPLPEGAAATCNPVRRPQGCGATVLEAMP